MIGSYSTLCSTYYDLSKSIHAKYDDVEYFKKHLHRIGGSVLEIGCGTGRMLIPLLQSGLQIDGIDFSSEMLEICKKNCSQMNVHSDLYTMKMEELNLDKTYNSMFIPFGSFQLISDRTLAREALLRFRKHMNKNGELFIPLFLPFDEFKDANKWQMLGQVQEKDGSLIILHGCSTFRYNEQRQDNWNRYEKWKDGKIVATELENMSMRWYGRYEFESLLQETGFEIVSVDGDYSDSPLSDSHAMMCFRALKK